jgi:hypothetical protein
MSKVTVRADFFDDYQDTVPSRSLIISAFSEEEVVESAAAEMHDAASVELERGLFLAHRLGVVSSERSQATARIVPWL